MFIKSVIGYCDVLRDTKPKRDKIRMLEQELEKSAEILQNLNTERIKTESNLENVKQNYADAINEKAQLTIQLKESESKLVSQSLVINLYYTSLLYIYVSSSGSWNCTSCFGLF